MAGTIADAAGWATGWLLILDNVERALAITEKALGPGHPDTALRMGNLAATYRDLGRPARPADAAPLEERARQIRQRPR